MKEKELKMAIASLFIGVILLFFLFDPSDFSFFLSCYFKKFTGFDCPGCGGQRALHDLLHFRFVEAADHNLLIVAGSPVLGFVVMNAFFFEKKKYFTPKFLWIICVVVLTFWIVRNLPIDALDLPIDALEWLRAGEL